MPSIGRAVPVTVALALAVVAGPVAALDLNPVLDAKDQVPAPPPPSLDGDPVTGYAAKAAGHAAGCPGQAGGPNFDGPEPRPPSAVKAVGRIRQCLEETPPPDLGGLGEGSSDPPGRNPIVDPDRAVPPEHVRTGGSDPASRSVPDPVRYGTAAGPGRLLPGGGGDLAIPVPVATATAVVAVALYVLYRRLERDEPGLAAGELADALDVAVTTVLYHGRVLSEHGLLLVEREGRRVTYFDPARHDAFERLFGGTLRKGPKRDLVELVDRDPGIRMAELARRMDRVESTIKYHVDDLVDEGLLREERAGGARRFEVPAPVARRLAKDRA